MGQREIYDTNNKWLGHPLQKRVDNGEVQLIDHLDIPEEEFKAKIALLEPEEQEIAIWARQKRLKLSSTSNGSKEAV